MKNAEVSFVCTPAEMQQQVDKFGENLLKFYTVLDELGFQCEQFNPANLIDKDAYFGECPKSALCDKIKE